MEGLDFDCVATTIAKQPEELKLLLAENNTKQLKTPIQYIWRGKELKIHSPVNYTGTLENDDFSNKFFVDGLNFNKFYIRKEQDLQFDLNEKSLLSYCFIVSPYQYTTINIVCEHSF